MKLTEKDKKILALLKIKPLKWIMIEREVANVSAKLPALLSEKLIGVLRTNYTSMYYTAGDRQRAENILFSEKGSTPHIKNPEYNLPKSRIGGERVSLSKMKRSLKVIGAKE